MTSKSNEIIMNQEILYQKLHALSAFPNIKADKAAKFGEILKQLDDWDLLRINPLSFAEEHGFDRLDSVELFIHGAKIGLFDFVWNMVCPSCGGTEYTHRSINEIEESIFHCSICHFDVPSNLDDQVEVAFMINPSIKKLDVSPFKDKDNYERFFFSPNFERSQPLEDYINDVKRSVALIEPDESKEVVFEAKPGELYRLLSIDLHSAMSMQTTDQQGSGTQAVNIDIVPAGLSPVDKLIAPGRVTLRIQNLCNRPAGAILVLTDPPRIKHILEHNPSRFRPFLTGKMLLNNQGFRELFRVQNLVPNLKLNIRSLTILFTDLKGSTELYDITGDAFAYNLVQEHFKILTGSVRRNSGAIVKTMGDAIMATFSLPQEGVNAAVEMINEMQSLNE